MDKRELFFRSYEEMIAEINELEEKGYETHGQWSLGQICHHINYYLRGSLEGFSFRLPSIFVWFIGKPFLWYFLHQNKMSGAKYTVPESLPSRDCDDRESAEETVKLLKRVSLAESFHPSPFFGNLKKEEWRKMHLLHGAHHLSFLSREAAKTSKID